MTSVVIVVDESIVIHSLSKYIYTQLSDYEILGTFSNGADALCYLQSHPADIVISDILMPQMDGLELAKQISELMPQCVTIILSGFSEFQYAQQAIQYNVFTYLLKPLDYRELKNVLEQATAVAAARKSARCVRHFAADPVTQFFCDVLFDAVSSPQELRRRYDALGFCVPFEKACGYLLKVTPDCPAESIVSMIPDTLGVLRRCLETDGIYYVRHTERDLFFIVLGCASLSSGQTAHASSMLTEANRLSCNAEVYRKFASLMEFVSNDNSPNPPKHEETPNSQLIQKAIHYVETHFADDLSRESVAARLYLSPSHFSSLFKQETGCTFKEYLTNVRMQAAIKFLGTQMSVNDIARQVGYLNRNRFIVNFKDYTSYTPTEYRKQVLSMKEEDS